MALRRFPTKAGTDMATHTHTNREQLFASVKLGQREYFPAVKTFLLLISSIILWQLNTLCFVPFLMMYPLTVFLDSGDKN